MEDKPHEYGKAVSILRDGFTTGTCAAAAAKAAAVLLCGGMWQQVQVKKNGYLPMELTTPAGIKAYFDAELVSCQADMVCCRVKKDAGDDPDVTDKAWIEAEVRLTGQPVWEQTAGRGPEAGVVPGSGYVLKQYPQYYLTGGPGVGIATKPGLSCPPGYYAINPVPRQMIVTEVAAVFAEAGLSPCVQIRISVPEGVALAEKTFNPRLGILGGISILGTTGIVKPMSEDALRDTIKLELHMKAAAGAGMVFVVPGNYGAQFLQDTLGIPMAEAVTCSNFAGDTMAYAAAEGLKRLLFIGHIGKLIKITGGVRNTHSRYGDRRMELLGGFTGRYNRELETQVRAANTTEEGIGILRSHDLSELVLDDAAAAVKQQMEAWGGGHVQVEVVTFSSAYGILGKTNQVMAWIDEWQHASN